MKQRPPTVYAYSDDQLEKIVEILRRAVDDDDHLGVGGRGTPRGQLEAELLDVLHATGLALDGSAESVIWAEMEASTSTEKQISEAFRAMAEASNPLDPTVCTLDLRSGVNGQLRLRGLSSWRGRDRHAYPTVQSLDWGALPDTDRAEIRAMARHLADYHYGHRAKPRRPRDTALDTALYMLAEIFLRHTGRSGTYEDVPHSVESRFIKFAVLALQPLSAQYEVSKAKALSRRWQRRREHERARPVLFPVLDLPSEK